MRSFSFCSSSRPHFGEFEQAPTSLNLFASDFTNRDILGFEVPVLWFQSINSLFIIIFAPVFAAMWVGMSRRRMDLSDPAKFTVALILAGVGFALMVIPANAIVASGGALKSGRGGSPSAICSRPW